MVAQFTCIEGDGEFFSLLVNNMRQFTDVEIVNCLLAREERRIRSLVKHHRGTAAAIGSAYVLAVPLDSLCTKKSWNFDIVKVDVDGFDGEVLGGACKLLREQKPTVIFEWHPKLIDRTGNDPLFHFTTLSDCGYNQYLWFDNRGTFSHFTGCPTPRP
jgi:FkbM family methyltransferase